LAAVNRQEKIRRELPGAGDELVAQLADRPAADVAIITAALRQARLDAIAEDKVKRAQRRIDRRRLVEDEDQAAAASRQVKALGRRAAANLETLALLWAHYSIEQRDKVVGMAITGLRAERNPPSWAEIGAAIGMARQNAFNRYGGKGVIADITEDGASGDQPGEVA
jgi:hypothetical protein